MMLTLPPIGLGTWPLQGTDATRAVSDAIETGFRLIDTATGYDNELAVGTGIKDAGIDREDLTIVTKFPEEIAGLERQSLYRSLQLLGVDYVDLWLVHAPLDIDTNVNIWREFISAREQGLVRAIGVSNFTPNLIDDLIAATGVSPQVSQIAFGPRHYDPVIRQYHKSRGITLQAHSPFTANDLWDPVLQRLAERHNCTVHQIILRWHLEHQVPTVTRAATATHQLANLAAAQLRLTADEVREIDSKTAQRF